MATVQSTFGTPRPRRVVACALAAVGLSRIQRQPELSAAGGLLGQPLLQVGVRLPDAGSGQGLCLLLVDLLNPAPSRQLRTHTAQHTAQNLSAGGARLSVFQ